MNDGPRQMLEQNPLMKFSLYTHTQAQGLDRIGKEIIRLSQNWTDEITDHQPVYDLFWLWVLGAYEVVRTMEQHKACFAAHLQLKISLQKETLADIRMPFATQQMRGDGEPLYAELSVAGIDNGMVFQIGPNEYNSNTIIEDCLMFFQAIKLEDILKTIPLREPPRK